jgi:predicted phage baseplate assembly protein
MPLRDHVPPIDDRRFEDLLAEVRARIARYTPEWVPDPVWTDVNDSDPGITMAQVFAWLAEMLTYRMNKVPELNYIKFLELIGIELTPAWPAVAHVTFPVDPTFAAETVIVPLRAQVSAEATDGGPPVVFETDRALVALRARLIDVLVHDGYSAALATAANDDGESGFQPFGPRADVGSALMLGFNEALPAGEQIDLTVWVQSDLGRTAAVTCGDAVPAPARVAWEYWNGATWEALERLDDQTNAFTRSGRLVLKAPPANAMQSVSVPPAPVPEFWLRARLDTSQYERAPTIRAVRTNTATATQAETTVNEVLGGSSGRPNQTFQLDNVPVLLDTLQIEVDEGRGWQPWTRVDDLLGSGPNDPHYVLDRTSGEVRFGDGFHGRIPVANVDNPLASIVARTYRFGGGKRGNVPARALATMLTSVDGIDQSQVHNPYPASGGRAEETLREAKLRAPLALRSRNRAVTAADFEHLATQVGNVKRAKALAFHHPDFPGVQVPGVVTVIVVPEGDADDAAPMPSDATLRAVCKCLDDRRLLTTELYVVRPTYQTVKVLTDVVVEPDADLAEVRDKIEQTLRTYFHPLTGGETEDGWPFGGTIFYSRVYQRVFTVPRVQSIERLVIVLDGREQPECRNVDLLPTALVTSDGHRVTVRYAFEA